MSAGPSKATSDAFEVRARRPVLVSGVVLHALPPGYRFDLGARVLLPRLQAIPTPRRPARPGGGAGGPPGRPARRGGKTGVLGPQPPPPPSWTRPTTTRQATATTAVQSVATPASARLLILSAP
jgi:hypothetical protein